MSTIAIVIAAYNEEHTIRDLAERVLQQCPNLFVVDDGSADGTVAALQGLPLTLLRHRDNQGKAAALWTGFRAALAHGAEAVVTLDGDGQHSPEDIPRLAGRGRERPGDIVIGSRMAQAGAFPRARLYANRFANFWISWAAGYWIEDSQSGFRLYPTALLRQLNVRPTPADSFVFESEILIEAARRGFGSVAVPIAAVYRHQARPSHFRPVADILRITRMVGGRLLKSRMNPRGLYEVAARPTLERLAALRQGGAASLLLSLLVMLASLGVSYLWAVAHTARVGKRTRCTATGVDVLLVPGLALSAGAVSDDFARRLDRAARLLAEAPQRRVLLLGGRAHGPGGISEAEAGRAYLSRRGVPGEAMMLEERSRNTLENLRHARAMLPPGATSALITNRYHLARCHALASSLRIAHVLCAAEDRFRWSPAMLLHVFREAFHLHWFHVGRLWARWSGNGELLRRIT